MTSRSDTYYEHVQSARTALLVGVALIPLLVVVAVYSDTEESIVLVPVLLAVVLIIGLINALSRLKVEVGPEAVRLAFSYGWPRRVIRRADIQSVAVVRNSPIWGWGIRWIPGGWMWNVWGLDAVELRLVSGRRFRIGTDDPQGLAAALSA